MMKSIDETILTKKNTALLNWILCESGVHNITFDKKECSRLHKIYEKVCREEDSKDNKVVN